MGDSGLPSRMGRVCEELWTESQLGGLRVSTGFCGPIPYAPVRSSLERSGGRREGRNGMQVGRRGERREEQEGRTGGAYKENPWKRGHHQPACAQSRAAVGTVRLTGVPQILITWVLGIRAQPHPAQFA